MKLRIAFVWIFLCFLAMMIPIGIEADWTSIHTGFASSTINDIWGTSPSNLFVVGDDGYICHWNGETWSDQPLGMDLNFDLEGVWGSSADDVWAVGDKYSDPVILHWEGQSWQNVDVTFDEPLQGIWGFAQNDIYAAGSNYRDSVIVHFDGTNWTLQETLQDISVKHLWGADPNYVMAVGDNGESVLWDGSNWNILPVSDFSYVKDIWGFSRHNIYLVGTYQLWHWNGSNWNDESEGMENFYGCSIWGSAADDIYAVSSSGGSNTIRHYNGSEWQIIPYYFPDGLSCAWGFDKNYMFIAGRYSMIWDGSGWQYAYNGISDSLYTVEILDDGTIVIGGDDGQFYTWNGESFATLGYFNVEKICETGDGNLLAMSSSKLARFNGGHWEPLYEYYKMEFSDIAPYKEKEAFIVDRFGTIFHWDGNCLKTKINIPDSSLWQICSVGGNEYYIRATMHGKSTLLRWDCQTWQEIEFDEAISVVWGNSANNVFAGTSGKMTHWNGQTWTWTDIESAGSINSIWASSPDDVYATDRSEVIYHWDGQSWSTETNPTSGKLYGVCGSRSDHVLAAGLSGTLIQWDGQSWTVLDSGTEKSLSDVFITSTGHQYAYGYGSIVLRESNGSWNQIFCPDDNPFVSIWESDTGTIYTGQFNDAIFKFNGKSWERLNDFWTHPIGHVNGIWGGSDSDFIAVGGQTILHYNGQEFEEMVHPEIYGEFREIWGSSHDNIFLSADNTIMRWDGQVWSVGFENGANHSFCGIWGQGPDEIFAVSQVGTVFLWDGVSWSKSQEENYYPLEFVALAGSSPEDIYALAQDSSYLHWDGIEWIFNETPQRYPLNDLAVSTDGTLFSVGEHGVILTSQNTTGVNLVMPSHQFHSGDPCWLKADVFNPNSQMNQIPFFVLLDAYGEYFCYPSWCHYPDECDVPDYETYNFRNGTTHITVLEEFQWPQVGGSASGLYFYSALVDLEKGELIGNLASWEFGY